MRSNLGAKIKKAFKDLKIDLVTAPEELIFDVIQNTVGHMQFEKRKKDLIEILENRNVSVNVNYNTCFVQSLHEDKTSWKKLEKDVTVKGKNGKVVEATLSSTPASEFGYFTNLKKGTGVGSNERNTDQAMNMWKTEVKSKSGDVLFSGLRHGNTRGKASSSKEIILAAAVQQYGIEKLQKSSENYVWEVRLGNIQLMSPGLIKGLADGNMPFKQMQTFRDIASKGPFKVNIKGEDGKPKKITLKLIKPILVNFGTNAQHYAMGGALVKSSYKQNRQSFVDLFGEDTMDKLEKKKSTNSLNDKSFQGEVGEYLTKLNETYKKISNAKNEQEIKKLDLKKKKIINLSKQILDIWVTTNGRGKKTDPAAIQTRLAALMYLIDYPVSFNCKSGKDRTGEVAAEINDLMLTMEANDGDVPTPYSELSDKEKLQASDIFDATQSDVITQANTGHRGLKVNLKGTTDRFGNISGASKNAKG